jgi:hypothetical protein
MTPGTVEQMPARSVEDNALLTLRRRFEAGADRIARQKCLIAELERDGSGLKWLDSAYDLLKAMQVAHGHVEECIINLAIDSLGDWPWDHLVPTGANDGASSEEPNGTRPNLP